MEQERGISITASAMQFPYKDAVINLLDTPGHQDFSEDTYRTLTAADSAIMVDRCRQRCRNADARSCLPSAVCARIPVLTFVNKMDLPGRPPLDLMTEVEQALNIHASAVNWPIGSGSDFRGHRDASETAASALFSKTAHGGATKGRRGDDGAGRTRKQAGAYPQEVMGQVQHDLELLDIAGNRIFARRVLGRRT